MAAGGRPGWPRAVLFACGHNAVRSPMAAGQLKPLLGSGHYVASAGVRKDELTRLKRTDTPDLRGGVKYVDSPRHANYVERGTFMAYLAQFRDRFGWHDVDDHTYDDLRANAPSSPSAAEPPKEPSHV